jgi:hypothetical protein
MRYDSVFLHSSIHPDITAIDGCLVVESLTPILEVLYCSVKFPRMIGDSDRVQDDVFQRSGNGCVAL